MTGRQTADPTPLQGQKFHLIGIGGAGMSPLAKLLAAAGAQVAGSDRADSPTLKDLAAQGITTYVGHRAEQVDAQATLVYSSAVKSDNPEVAVARERGQEIIHRSQALARLAQGRDFYAVAGAHGKTTTSGMLAQALLEVGADPSFAVGGVVKACGSGARWGQGRAFIAEADESDGSFLNYQPHTALVTNIEPDHLDHYGSRQAFEAAFRDFAQLLAPGGHLVLCADDPGARSLGEDLCAQRPDLWIETYGFGPGLPAGGHLQLSAESEDSTGSAVRLDFLPSPTSSQTEPGIFPTVLRLQAAGRHNLLNAAGAFLAGREACPGKETKLLAALENFAGTGRRMEEKARVAGGGGQIRIFDDYAHHPTEVAAALAGARQLAGSGRVLVVFQPHLYSRTRNFASEFAAALAQADYAVVAGVYGAREEPQAGVEGNLISDKLPAGRGEFIADRFAAARRLGQLAQAGDLVLTMGAGNITECWEEIARAFASEASGEIPGEGSGQ